MKLRLIATIKKNSFEDSRKAKSTWYTELDPIPSLDPEPFFDSVRGSKKKDPRKTPAPKKDRIKGSDKNPKGTAKTTRGGIKMTKDIINSLKEKVEKHNEKHDHRATLGMLKAVYRRGAGAYSTSHRPGISRGAWAMARVNAFLKLLRSGRPANSNYVQDNDLLPSGHPKKSKS